MIGECFYYDTFPNDEHLFVVIAPSLTEENWFLCVNITTKREGSDTTCEICKGEHPNLTKPVSVVDYGRARELPLALIERLTKLQQLPKVGDDLLLKMQMAPLGETSRLKNAFKKALVAHLRSKGKLS
jgi:hypothetical protein